MKRTILFVAANPRGTERLGLDEECRAIQHELRLTEGRGDFDFHSRWAVDVEELMRCLLELRPAVLHFSGHGARSAADAGHESTGAHREITSPHSAGIVLQDRDSAQYVEHHALAKMIASVREVPRLVVLNACYSAAVADGLRQVVDCIVGVDDAIEDVAARKFAVGLYRAIGYRYAVGEAVKHAAATLCGLQLPGEIVTCHTRRGVESNRLYLSGPQATERPPVGEPSRAAAPIAGELTKPEVAILEPQTRRARDTSPRLTRAPSQPTGSGTWPTAAAPYDLFVSHPAANRATASALYDLLQPDMCVFLAARSLSHSDRREQAISAAQRNSRASVLLISRQADACWYLGDEVTTAIALHRATTGAHRILPVLLGAGIARPRCLSAVEPIVATAGDLSSAAAQLRALGAALPPFTAPWSTAPPERRANGEHVRLYDRLCKLTDAVFEQIVTHAKIDRDSFAPRTASLADRALDIALLAALDPALCRRISTELDRRAPWTRP